VKVLHRSQTMTTNCASDIWSLGCMLYELLTGKFFVHNEVREPKSIPYLALNSFTMNLYGRMEVQQRYSSLSLKMRANFFLQQKWVYCVNVLPWVVGTSVKQHPIRFVDMLSYISFHPVIRCGPNTQSLVNIFLSFYPRFSWRLTKYYASA
jgi:serine/threonine protein kinase